MTRAARLLLPFAAASFVASTVVACGGARSTGSSVPAPKAAVAPPGVTLVAACTPTGAELCFNAVDDNCNGVFEEGCGLRTGPLQFMIAWSGSDANVDLAVTSPNGERTSKENRSPSSGLRFEKDCPLETCHGQDYENVYLEEASIARGHYDVEIRLREAGPGSGPVTVRFGARVGAGTYGADVVLTRSDDTKSFGFDL